LDWALLNGLLLEKSYRPMRYLEPIATARLVVAELRRLKCDMTICLSHLGYQYASDKVLDHTLAQQVEGLDLILGGHTHTFPDQPTLLKSPGGQEVVVNQAGWAGLRLGRIDYVFLPRQRGIRVSGTSLSIGDEKNFSVGSTGS
jgi:5'-nucleotidase